MSALISVIIPIYNTEKYLERCIESALTQTYKNIEIICINDGSNDNSQAILEEFSKTDSRIKIVTQKNQGQSVARNNGVKISTGEFIFFLDSDDAIHKRCLELLISAIDEFKTQIAFNTGIAKLKTNSDETISDIKAQCIENPLEKLVTNKRFASPWNKLYKRDLVVQIPFTPNIYFEDWVFNCCIFSKVEKCAVINAPAYFYEQGNASTTRSSFNAKKAKSYLVGIHETQHFFERENDQKNWKIVRKKRIPITLKMLVSKINNAKENREELVKILIPELKNLHKNGAFKYSDLTLKTKIRILKLALKFKQNIF